MLLISMNENNEVYKNDASQLNELCSLLRRFNKHVLGHTAGQETHTAFKTQKLHFYVDSFQTTAFSYFIPSSIDKQQKMHKQKYIVPCRATQAMMLY